MFIQFSSTEGNYCKHHNPFKKSKNNSQSFYFKKASFKCPNGTTDWHLATIGHAVLEIYCKKKRN